VDACLQTLSLSQQLDDLRIDLAVVRRACCGEAAESQFLKRLTSEERPIVTSFVLWTQRVDLLSQADDLPSGGGDVSTDCVRSHVAFCVSAIGETTGVLCGLVHF